MNWSWRIGRLFGIELMMHVTFPLLLLWVVASHWLVSGRWAEAMGECLFVVAVFGVVVLHELGHALAARRYGIATRDITLLPIGGVARLERMPDDPRQELVVALAGPAVNVVIAAGLYVLLTTSSAATWSSSLLEGNFLTRFMFVNVWLVLFNLLPAFPMDGGRVLRALLALRIGSERATRIAAGIGQGMAVLLGFIGLFINPLLVVVALFVWAGAAQEAAMVEHRTTLRGTVRRAMITELRVLDADAPLETAMEHILAGFQQDFPVVERDRPIGVLTRGDLLAALARNGDALPIRAAMTAGFVAVTPDASLADALALLQPSRCHTLLVIDRRRLVGIVNLENVMELLLIQKALDSRVETVIRSREASVS